MAIVRRLRDRSTHFLTREPRAVIGGSVLCCIVFVDLVAAVTW